MIDDVMHDDAALVKKSQNYKSLDLGGEKKHCDIAAASYGKFCS